MISRRNPDLSELISDEGGIILIDKPYYWSSFKVIHELRKRAGVRKAGHAGTLDPHATGLLIICSQRKTKIIDTFQGLPKTYSGTLRLGQATPSMDTETDVNEEKPISHINESFIAEALSGFKGEILQTPPMYSAVNHQGKKLYQLARKGEEIERKARKITIDEFNITRIELPEIDFRIVCSRGTYIRVLAADFGLALQSCAHLTALRRLAIGEFHVDDAFLPSEVFANYTLQFGNRNSGDGKVAL
jgi:tRNA pseudouridine55 synthase